jgi:hypothetical protein
MTGFVPTPAPASARCIDALRGFLHCASTPVASMTPRRLLHALAALALLLPARTLWAYSFGISGYSGRAGVICTACHGGGNAPSVSFSGPATLTPAETGTFTFIVTSAAPQRQIAAGFNIAASGGTLQTVFRQGTQLLGTELTHTQPKQNVGGQATWDFKWTAPATPGNYILWGAGNSVNLNQTTSGDNAAGTMFFIAVGGVATVTPTITPPPSPTRTPSPAPTPSSSATSTLAPATDTPTLTQTPTDTMTPTPTATATQSPTPPIAGDANCDALFTAADLTALVAQLATGEEPRCGADANANGALDDEDIATTCGLIFGP